MNRDRLLSQLLNLREHQLRTHSAELKVRNARLAEVAGLGRQARSAAADVLTLPDRLVDLGAIGAARLRCIRLARNMSEQVRLLSRKVVHARKLADVTRGVRDELRRTQDAERERLSEMEAEHFIAWKNGRKSGR